MMQTCAQQHRISKAQQPSLYHAPSQEVVEDTTTFFFFLALVGGEGGDGAVSHKTSCTRHVDVTQTSCHSPREVDEVELPVPHHLLAVWHALLDHDLEGEDGVTPAGDEG